MDLRGSYFEKIGEHRPYLLHPMMQTRSFFREFPIAKRLQLSYPGIDNGVLAEVQRCKEFDKMEELILYMTSVSAEGIDRLRRPRALKRFEVDHKLRTISSYDMQQFKKRFPECTVKLNNYEISG